jgi:Response regulator receiver domain
VSVSAGAVTAELELTGSSRAAKDERVRCFRRPGAALPTSIPNLTMIVARKLVEILEKPFFEKASLIFHKSLSQFNFTRPAMILLGRRLFIFIADDNRDLAWSLSVLFRLAGFDVETVHDGHEVLRAVRARRPDAVLLDIGLPGMNGFQVAERRLSQCVKIAKDMHRSPRSVLPASRQSLLSAVSQDTGYRRLASTACGKTSSAP